MFSSWPPEQPLSGKMEIWWTWPMGACMSHWGWVYFMIQICLSLVRVFVYNLRKQHILYIMFLFCIIIAMPAVLWDYNDLFTPENKTGGQKCKIFAWWRHHMTGLFITWSISLFVISQTDSMCPTVVFCLVWPIVTSHSNKSIHWLPNTKRSPSIEGWTHQVVRLVNMSLLFALYWLCITRFLRIETQIFHTLASCWQNVMLMNGILNLLCIAKQHFNTLVLHRLRDRAHSVSMQSDVCIRLNPTQEHKQIVRYFSILLKSGYLFVHW